MMSLCQHLIFPFLFLNGYTYMIIHSKYLLRFYIFTIIYSLFVFFLLRITEMEVSSESESETETETSESESGSSSDEDGKFSPQKIYVMLLKLPPLRIDEWSCSAT